MRFADISDRYSSITLPLDLSFILLIYKVLIFVNQTQWTCTLLFYSLFGIIYSKLFKGKVTSNEHPIVIYFLKNIVSLAIPCISYI